MGLEVLDQALAAVNATGMRFYEAELYRLQGQLQLLPGTTQHLGRAEASFEKSLKVARQQGAKSLELRAAMHLSSLWHQQGNSHAAKQLLTPIYHWFKEGFETADLQESAVILKTLG